MSLVGSLEDLGLADILQIVSLSRKSGLLLLRSPQGDGRIVFHDGLVRAAFVKGEPEDLTALLASSGFAEPDEVARALETARENGLPPDELVASRTGLGIERLDSLRREHIERAVLRMFSWRVGEFSFDVRESMDERDRPLALRTGMNAQYLTMEATRLGDEGGRDPAGAASGPLEDVDGLVLSGDAGPPPDAPAASAPPADARHVAAFAAVEREAAAAAADDAEPEPPEPQPVESARQAAAAASPGAAGNGLAPLIAVEADLRLLEWVKASLQGVFARIHIFQHCEAAIARVWQYLGRGEIPTVLISSRLAPDPLGGRADLAQLLARLRAQAPRMPIFVLHEGDPVAVSGFGAVDGVVMRPAAAALGERRRRAEVEQAAARLRAALEPWAARPAGLPAGRVRPGAPASGRVAAPAAAATGPPLERLREISNRLRDPSTLGEVLTLVLDFASEHFGRVAMFMVRDDDAVGMAQRRLAAAGGPDDARFREVVVPVAETGWFRRVVETREAWRGAPGDAGDRSLAARLGRGLPAEVLVAPIESGGRVAALLYADNLPGKQPLGDPTALDIVLHEAGLALDRALLERALAAASGGERGA